MTFATSVKEEISKQEIDIVSATSELSAFVKYDGEITKESITLNTENASVARRLYTLIKLVFGIKPQIIVRVQKRFRIKQIYILEINSDIKRILETLNIMKEQKLNDIYDFFLDTKEDKIAYLKGAFLSCGSITNPQSHNYHLEFKLPHKKDALFINSILNEFNISGKVIKRENIYVLYIKTAETISDILKLFNATNSMFFFEDIRIYRDHKNMVNRLNNCEIANQERVIKSGLAQLEDINYLKEHDLVNLLDDKIKDAIYYREKYPESSFQELAEIISSETGNQIGKSGINHYFRKIKDLVNKHKNKNS